MQNLSYPLIVLVLPLLSFLFLCFFGRFIGKNGTFIFSPVLILFSVLFSFFSIFEMLSSSGFMYATLGAWVTCGDFVAEWGFMFDSLALVMFLVVSFVSLCVHVYSINYMWEDPGFIRFFSYISLFTFFMLFLVCSDNFLQLLVGWEGVGICSFLLVSFWFSRTQTLKSALKALVFNRVGDCGFIVGILLVFENYRTLNFDALSLIYPYIGLKFYCFSCWGFDLNVSALNLICFFLLFGIVGKSAQIGLHCWLPEAMEGPTPVSALIHAATMVTAGIFLVLRCSFFFQACSNILSLLFFFGGLTVFFGTIVGLSQFDIKKVIAYSTCSQLGYMLVACACSNYKLAIFHLVNHAFIKALLFLTAGVIISQLGGEQDVRRMGGLLHILPLTYLFMAVGSFSLIGFPFLSGYYSKDLIIEYTTFKITFAHELVFWVISVSAFLTAFYSFRLLFLVFFVKTNVPFTIFFKIREMSKMVAAPLFFLFILSIFSGYFLFDFFLGFGNEIFAGILPTQKSEQSIDVEDLSIFIKLLPSFLSFLGFLFGINYDRVFGFTNSIVLAKKINCSFFLDSFFNSFFVISVLRFSLICCFRLVDKLLLELIGPKGIFFMTKGIFLNLNSVVFGRVDRLIFLSLYLVFLLFLLVCFTF